MRASRVEQERAVPNRCETRGGHRAARWGAARSVAWGGIPWEQLVDEPRVAADPASRQAHQDRRRHLLEHLAALQRLASRDHLEDALPGDVARRLGTGAAPGPPLTRKPPQGFRRGVLPRSPPVRLGRYTLTGAAGATRPGRCLRDDRVAHLADEHGEASQRVVVLGVLPRWARPSVMANVPGGGRAGWGRSFPTRI